MRKSTRRGFLKKTGAGVVGAAALRWNGVLACWPLAEERGDRVADSSGNGHHGRIINHATWMIGGPAFNADPAGITRLANGVITWKIGGAAFYSCPIVNTA